MLNRKLNDYIFVGVLLAILAVVLGIRSVALGNINNNIFELERSNKALNVKINNLEKLVEENKSTKPNHLFELYNRVPSYYSYDELYFTVLSQLYLVGINDTPEFNSEVQVTDDKVEVRIPGYEDINTDFTAVEVSVSFNVVSLDTVEDLIQDLYGAEQVYLINSITFNVPEEGQFVTVVITFYTFYNIENGS